MKTCKVCFKRYSPRIAHEVLSHTHQGQGPEDKQKRERRA